MTIDEARESFNKRVTVIIEGEKYKAYIIMVSESTHLVKIALGDMRQKPYVWAEPKDLTTGWQGKIYKQ